MVCDSFLLGLKGWFFQAFGFTLSRVGRMGRQHNREMQQ